MRLFATKTSNNSNNLINMYNIHKKVKTNTCRKALKKSIKRRRKPERYEVIVSFLFFFVLTFDKTNRMICVYQI